MRVIAGEFKNRRLRMPVGVRMRPTADRVKEGMFSVLGADLNGRIVLDLYAGSGSLGIEALSRGARHCTFVETHRQCLRALAENLLALGLKARSRIVRSPVEKALGRGAGTGTKFDICLADPPYFQGDTKNLLQLVVSSAILTPSALLVVEHHRDTTIPGIQGALELRTTKRYGDSAVSFFIHVK